MQIARLVVGFLDVLACHEPRVCGDLSEGLPVCCLVYYVCCQPLCVVYDGRVRDRAAVDLNESPYMRGRALV